MKRVVLIGALISSALVAAAQSDGYRESYDYSKKWNISFQVGPSYQIYENYFAYYNHRQGADLFNIQKTLNIGYDFTKSFGTRLSINYGDNSAAYNIEETADKIFRPYSFRSVDFFLDAILNISGLEDDLGPFSTKVFGGVGLGTSSGFKDDTDNPHPWQKYVTSNRALAFRVGVILEYDLPSDAGLFFEINGAGLSDNYNGLEPGEYNHWGEGYAGFPLDLKFFAGFGFIYHL